MRQRSIFILILFIVALATLVSAKAQTRFPLGTPAIERYHAPGADDRRRREVPLAILFALENDNLLLGAWSRTGWDGSDMGRTHGTLLQFSHVFDDGIAASLQLDTTLFTRRDGTSTGGRLGQYFSEENNFHLVIDSLLQGEGLYWTVGGGVSVLNGESITIGASGQQDLYHSIVHSFYPEELLYTYTPDGRGVRPAGFGEAGLGLFGSVLRDPYAVLTLQAHVMARFSSIWEGSAVMAAAGVALSLGRRDSEGNPILRVEGMEEINQYLTTASPELVTRVRAALLGDWADFFGSLEWRYGDPVNAYRIYNFNNVTMTLGLAVRVQ